MRALLVTCSWLPNCLLNRHYWPLRARCEVETVAAVFGAALCTGLSRFSHLAVCVMFQHSKGGAYLIKTYSTNQRILAPSRGCQNPFLSLITLSDGRRYGYQTVRDISYLWLVAVNLRLPPLSRVQILTLHRYVSWWHPKLITDRGFPTAEIFNRYG